MCGHIRLLSEGFCFLDIFIPQQRKRDSSFCKFAVNVDVVRLKVHTDCRVTFREEDLFDLFVGYGLVQRPGEVVGFSSSQKLTYLSLGRMQDSFDFPLTASFMEQP